MKVEVIEGPLEEVLAVMHEVPELDTPAPVEQWKSRLSSHPLLLIARVGAENVGFKVGYDRWQDGRTYYSWMGGVIPSFRRVGVASALQQAMEQWCTQHGYVSLRFKTRNRHRSMIAFALRHGFNMVDFEKKGAVDDYRLVFEKALEIVNS